MLPPAFPTLGPLGKEAYAPTLPATIKVDFALFVTSRHFSKQTEIVSFKNEKSIYNQSIIPITHLLFILILYSPARLANPAVD